MANNVEEHILKLRDEFSRKLEGIDAKVNKFRGGITKTQGSFSKLGAVAGRVFAALAVGQAVKQVTTLGLEMEQTRIAFSTFLGDTDKANQMIASLNEFANVTPFDNNKVIAASKTLLSFGFTADEIMPTLKILGDVSAGTGKDLAEMGVIFGQIRSAGRLMGQDLLQLINAGFNPLQVISQKTGKSVAVLKKEMEKGAISFDMVQQAFIDATSEGGLFFNLMEKQSKSVGGRISTLVGTLQLLGIRLGEAINQPLGKIVDGFQSFVKFIQANVQQLKEIFAPIGRALHPLRVAVDRILNPFNENLQKSATNGDRLKRVFNAIGRVVRFVAPFLEAWAEAVAIIAIKVAGAVRAIRDWAQETEGVGKLLAGLAEGFKAAFINIKQAAINILGGVADLITGIFTADLDLIEDALKDVGRGILKGNPIATGLKFGEGFKKGFQEGLGPTKDFFAPDLSGVSKVGVGTVLDPNKKPPPPAPSGAGDKLKSGLATVRSGAPKNITINIDSLIEEQTFNTGDLKESAARIKDTVTRVLLEALNDAQVIAR